MTFEQLGLCAPILTALNEQQYKTPSPIQEKAIPPALCGRDVLGCAQTGTGKTCAFATPILQRLSVQSASGHPIRALILTPTRELALQIGESFSAYGSHLKLRHAVIFGGVGQAPQVMALQRGLDILIATPGRLMDLYQQGFIKLDKLEIFVLDEADRMLDMGFIHDVKKILKWLPEKKQTLFFSATMPPEVSELVNSLLKNPVRVAVDPVSSPVDAISQCVYMVDRENKSALLAMLIKQEQIKNAIVFTRTKNGANRVARDLNRHGITAAAIHGNKSQTARQQALSDFKTGDVRCLVATDIAARGIDIEQLSHVFNYNLPEVPETYIHRIGRTGRAGHEGAAIAFCDFSEKSMLKEIEKLIARPLPVIEGHPFPMQCLQLPKKDRYGRIINAEDAAARQAARERRANAPQQGKTRAAQSPRQSPAQAALNTPEKMHSERSQPARRGRGVRSGAVANTGNATPRTDVHRPNPLESDVIMDATARLLAPRKSAVQTQAAPHGRSAHKGDAAAKKQNSQPAKKRIAPQPTAKKQATSTAAPAQAPQRRSRNHQNRPAQKRHSDPAQSVRSSAVKDSTEQNSLMKSYYLDF